MHFSTYKKKKKSTLQMLYEEENTFNMLVRRQVFHNAFW